jgi:hypothetical protein
MEPRPLSKVIGARADLVALSYISKTMPAPSTTLRSRSPCGSQAKMKTGKNRKGRARAEGCQRDPPVPGAGQLGLASEEPLEKAGSNRSPLPTSMAPLVLLWCYSLHASVRGVLTAARSDFSGTGINTGDFAVPCTGAPRCGRLKRALKVGKITGPFRPAEI